MNVLIKNNWRLSPKADGGGSGKILPSQQPLSEKNLPCRKIGRHNYERISKHCDSLAKEMQGMCKESPAINGMVQKEIRSLHSILTQA